MSYDILRILGILVAVFFFLAATNGLKKYVKNPIITAIAKQHRLFGALAALTAVVHMGFAVYLGMLRITGSLALIGIIVTAVLGATYSKGGNRTLYVAHRIAGPLTAVLIIVHIIFNSQY